MIDITVTVESQEVTAALLRLGPKLRRAQQNAVTEIKQGMVQDFQRTTATWQHKVEFKSYVATWGDSISARVTTDDAVYGYVDKGTRPHIIRPKDANGFLVFRWGGPGSYRAKTAPGVISSRNGGPAGPWRKFKQVHHPGTAARKFSASIRELWQRNAGRVLERHVQAQLASKW